MSNQIKYKMSRLEYERAFSSFLKNKRVYFNLEQVRAFIRMTHDEQKIIWADTYNYSRHGLKPNCVKNGKRWYHQSTNRLSQIKAVRKNAKELREDMT